MFLFGSNLHNRLVNTLGSKLNILTSITLVLLNPITFSRKLVFESGWHYITVKSWLLIKTSTCYEHLAVVKITANVTCVEANFEVEH